MTENNAIIYSNFLFPKNQILDSHAFSKYLTEFQERENQPKQLLDVLQQEIDSKNENIENSKMKN
jgi:hypothetical protein